MMHRKEYENFIYITQLGKTLKVVKDNCINVIETKDIITGSTGTAQVLGLPIEKALRCTEDQFNVIYVDETVAQDERAVLNNKKIQKSILPEFEWFTL